MRQQRNENTDTHTKPLPTPVTTEAERATKSRAGKILTHGVP